MTLRDKINNAGAYMKVYSIVAYDNAGDEPPRVSVFSSEDAAVQSVVGEVTEFASLHEAGGDFSIAEIPDTLKDGYVYEYESMDGFTYSWRLKTHVLINA